MAGNKNYCDLKYKFIRGLQRLEVYQRSKHWLKSAAECTSRAIVSLEIYDRPIKSLKQAEKLEGIGVELKRKLEKIKDDDFTKEDPPAKKKFVSSAAAILVALLESTELAYSEGHSKDSSVLVPEDVIKEKIKGMCEENFIDTEEGAVCPAWWRMEVLIRRDLVKRRTFKKSPVYILLPLGTEEALKLRESSGRLPITGSTVIPWNSPPDNSDALYTNYDGTDGVVLLVDISEMGGDRMGLGNLCRMIEEMGVIYKTKRLPVGDYSWSWRSNGQDRILPFLVERKRADDVARTLKEGRFWTQVTKMMEWKNQFVAKGLDCHLQYIIEGQPEQYMVKCMDGCQGVGMCGNPTVLQVKNALRDLRSHPDLIVQETENLQDTVIMLASITAELQKRTEKGDFDEMVVKEINDTIGVKKKPDFYVIDSDDEKDVPVIDLDSDSNSPNNIDTKPQRFVTNPSKCKNNETKNNQYSNNNDKGDNLVPFDDLPLEPLVQYHCAHGKQATPTKPRTTPSKYHVAGAYKPKINYQNDSIINKPSVSCQDRNLNKDSEKKCQDENLSCKSASKKKNRKHNLDNLEPRKLPRSKMFKMGSTSTASEDDEVDSKKLKSLPYTPQRTVKRFVSLPSVDSAISSEEEIEIDEDVQYFLENETKEVPKNTIKRPKIDSALSDSDSDSLPDLNFGTFPDLSSVKCNTSYKNTHLAARSEQSKVSVTKKQSDQIGTVKNILPHLSSSRIQSVLQRHGWNVDLAVTELLDTDSIL